MNVAGKTKRQFSQADIAKARKRIGRKPKQPKKVLSFAEKLQKTVEKNNKRAIENYSMYATACVKQGKKVGEPINIFDL